MMRKLMKSIKIILELLIKNELGKSYISISPSSVEFLANITTNI